MDGITEDPAQEQFPSIIEYERESLEKDYSITSEGFVALAGTSGSG